MVRTTSLSQSSTIESDCLPGVPHPRFATQLIGHEPAEATLLTAYQSGRMPHALLIGGVEGIGKATLAWRFAKFMLAHPDPNTPDVQQATTLALPQIHPIHARVNSLAHGNLMLLRRTWNETSKKLYTDIRVDDVRRAIHFFQQASSEVGWRIAILDSADFLNKSSSNALLKLIEEPPQKSLFLIITHRPGRVMPTIRSRCQHVLLSPLSASQISQVVGQLPEGWPFPTPEVLAHANGSVRQALHWLNEGNQALLTQTQLIFKHLPDVNWRLVQALVDQMVEQENQAKFETFIGLCYDFISQKIASLSKQSPILLVKWANLWEKLAESLRDINIYNLDRRPLILSFFQELALIDR